MGAIETTLACECGGSVVARAADAGSTVACPCGRSVRIPRLSQLRTLAGKDAFVTNPVEAIEKAQRSGRSPAGDKCLLCGAQSPAHYRCDAVCESTHVKRGGGAEANDIPHLLAYVFFGWLIGWLVTRSGGPSDAEVQGHDVGVTFDLPVCEQCSATSKPTRPAVAKEIMRRVPEYEELLKRYPELTLSVKRSAA